MKNRLLLPAVLACASLTCALVATFALAEPAEAERKTEAEEPQLGQDWRNLRNSLNDIYRKLQSDSGIRPAPIVDDDRFLRRVYLDLLGVPPTPQEIAAFRPGRRDSEGRRGQEKREALVEELLARPEFAENFAGWWRTVMIGRQGNGRYRSMLESYLQEAFQGNKPFNQIVHEIIAVEGDSNDRPEMGFLLSFQNEREAIAGETSKIFLGRQIQCAECHDHPYEEWKEDDFESFLGFFRLFRTTAEGEGADRYWRTVDTKPRNAQDLERRLRMRGRYKLPRYLMGTGYEFDTEKTLRHSLADWMTSPDNEWFREMTVNRMMAYFMGVGFVSPVDDFNSLNEPVYPIILSIMGRDFAASGFDFQYLVRAIVNSELYQRDVSLNRSNRNDRAFYSRQFVRRLTPEQIERSILHVTGIDRLNPLPHVRDVPRERLNDAERRDLGQRNRILGHKRAISNAIRDAWGADPIVRDVDDYDGSILQALMFMNLNLLGPPELNSSLKEILENYESRNDRMSQIFQTVLGRRPDSRDAAIVETLFRNRRANDVSVYEDLFLALMCTAEFAMNH